MSGVDDPAANFFRVIVRPTVLEYLRNPSEIRFGCLAAIVLWTTVDHHFAARIQMLPCGGDRRAAREAFVARGTEFAVLRDVAEATKHAVLRNDGNGIRFSEVRSGIPPGAGGYGTPALAYSVTGVYASQNVFVGIGGSFLSLERCVRVVSSYWASEFDVDITEL